MLFLFLLILRTVEAHVYLKFLFEHILLNSPLVIISVVEVISDLESLVLSLLLQNVVFCIPEVIVESLDLLLLVGKSTRLNLLVSFQMLSTLVFSSSAFVNRKVDQRSANLNGLFSSGRKG
mmetsp:Transcript_39583/g.38106  ORF Transcript_39583/g.38106 Transcript_39583/m.38106 type:complete len:121 (+) Transcript_39583:388-750(+)